jgi:hypothetical protein
MPGPQSHPEPDRGPMTELTPHALAQTRRWATLLATDDTAPAWHPFVGYSTPDSLRAAAQWLVDEGHAPGLRHEMVCILLAIYVIDVASEADGGLGGAFIPRDAA